MNKKGFTLVELLAVIAILAILVIIAMPNVMGMFQGAKQNTFVTELQTIYKSVQTQYVQDVIKANGKNLFCYGRKDTKNCTTKSGAATETYWGTLDLSGNAKIDYEICVNSSGEVVSYNATDKTFEFTSGTNTDLKIEEITATEIAKKDENGNTSADVTITCTIPTNN